MTTVCKICKEEKTEFDFSPYRYNGTICFDCESKKKVECFNCGTVKERSVMSTTEDCKNYLCFKCFSNEKE